MDIKYRSLYITFWSCILFSLIFTALIWIFSGRLDEFTHLPDQGALWYYWKLETADAISRLTSWGGYILHQVCVWVIVFRAVKNKKMDGALTNLNKAMLGINFIFIVLHFIQTHIWYDGIAQDVPVWTSQASVIIMLIIVLIMLNKKRGLIWGKKAPIPASVEKFVRKYHGIYISWALVYTFWFHPMEGYSGFLTGFLYMFFLFTQMSLFKTRIHFTLFWITFLEFFIVIHGTLVPIMKEQTIWPMFLGGFLMMTLLTQMHGFNLNKWSKTAAVVVYFAIVIPSYSSRGYDKLYEVIFNPIIYYAGVYFITGLVYGGLKITRRI